MKKNLYTQVMKNITAPQSLVDETLSKLNTANGEIIAIEKPKRRALKFTSAVAAVLALIIGLSVIPFGGNSNKPDSEHNFVIKAGAAEITPDTYISLGLLESSSEGGLYRYMDLEFKEAMVLEVEREFNIDIQCSGENIESVTYTANNGYLQYYPYFEGLIDTVELSDEDYEKYGAGGSTNGSLIASACTYDYYNQPRSLWDPEVMGFEIPEDSIDGTVPLRMAITFFLEEGKYIRPLLHEHFVEDDDIFYSEFNAHADEFSLDVTANFTDGTHLTKTLKFMCDDSMTQLQLLVTEVIE